MLSIFVGKPQHYDVFVENFTQPMNPIVPAGHDHDKTSGLIH